MLDFIARAKDSSFSLRAAIYELRSPEVLAAFNAAKGTGASVQIIYHDLPDETGTKNDEAIAKTQIRGLWIERTNAKLMHNKFMVLSKNGEPISVWTGSTNVSRNALFGQLNVGHAIHDRTLTQQLRAYWTGLKGDPLFEDLKGWTEEQNVISPADQTVALTQILSPHRGRGVFDCWIKRTNTAKPLFMTFPFGIVKDFRPVFDKNDGILRFALLYKCVNRGTHDSRVAAIADIERIRRLTNIGMALNTNIFVDWIDGWRKESAPLGVRVNWVHTKFMLIDLSETIGSL